MCKIIFILFLVCMAAHFVEAQTVLSKVSAELIASSETRIVRDAPFSGEAVSEIIQILVDGGRIRTESISKVYRDGNGRFRREAIANTNGGFMGLSPFLGSQYPVSISDPIKGVRYLLDSKSKQARQFVIPSPKTAGSSSREEIEKAEVAKRNVVIVEPSPNRGPMTVTEDLGTREIEGLKAVGSKTVTTVPANTFGNERSIQIINERWYSEDLKVVLSSYTSDPRYGEQRYTLRSIVRKEPDPSLFQIPDSYKIERVER